MEWNTNRPPTINIKPNEITADGSMVHVMIIGGYSIWDVKSTNN